MLKDDVSVDVNFGFFEHLLSVYRYFHWNLLLVKLTICLEAVIHLNLDNLEVQI